MEFFVTDTEKQTFPLASMNAPNLHRPQTVAAFFPANIR